MFVMILSAMNLFALLDTNRSKDGKKLKTPEIKPFLYVVWSLYVGPHCDMFICVQVLFFDFLFCFVLETSEGKYVSPFHDIPLIAETEQVTLW